MECSVIRDQNIHFGAAPFPDCAEFIIGPAKGRTRWLHPGYLPDAVKYFKSGGRCPFFVGIR